MNKEETYENVFRSLKSVLEPYAEKLVVEINEADNYYINTRFIMKNKKPMYFGSVKINRNYVSFHLMPAYVFPDILEAISPSLKKRMQGKSCFNFRSIDSNLFKELAIIVEQGYRRYDMAGYL